MTEKELTHHDGLSPGGLNVIEATMQVAQVPRPMISQSLIQRHPQLTKFLEGKNSEATFSQYPKVDTLYLEQELEPNGCLN